MPSDSNCEISSKTARQLAIMRQRLAGPRPRANSEGIMDVMRDIRYLQIDPMRIVAPSHTLVLWSRIGSYNPASLDTLLWKERRLFEDWAQATSIVLTEDYAIFKALKRAFASDDSAWAKRIRKWMEMNDEFRLYILDELNKKGPLLSSQFDDKAASNWSSSGWTSGRNINTMLFLLKAQGKVMVAGRNGNRKLWDTTEHFLPKWLVKCELSDREVARRVTQLSLRALGVARQKHIERHFVRGCYEKLGKVLAELEAEGQVVQVKIKDGRKRWHGSWYVHINEISVLDQLEAGNWKPRTTLLSPFDNLISDRSRTEHIFGFHFSFEVYVPKSKRKYGCYVMPILHGDRFIGRIDPAMDRKNKKLTINAVHAEPNAPKSRETAQAVANAVEALGRWLGAEEIRYSSRVPSFWKKELR